MKINWKKIGNLVPAIIQDSKTMEVLMLGYMNKESLKRTIKTGKVWFYSRTKSRLWMKGEKSGNTLEVKNVKTDCDSDTLLIKAIPKGPTCHKGTKTCFSDNIFEELYSVIESRKKEMPENSYTTSLFQEGINKICAKVEEESGEVIKAAKEETKKKVIEEGVDVIYHLFVLLAEKKVEISELTKEIRKRRK
ncbi:MAG: bifunctional phosphoribosyl-AMP cyclohydrolase/phosphoribosyl-ATP diphosphatase HisIE [Patescibacteria group bacterium]|nr:bifunctional phosphoribosyl-AMP cyclohydrolase/phosphoribosyl-ATP diphosphatase HisIE [Patescibacteria group bacterium]